MELSYVADALNYKIGFTRSHSNGENKDKFAVHRYELIYKLHITTKMAMGTLFFELKILKLLWRLFRETRDPP